MSQTSTQFSFLCAEPNCGGYLLSIIIPAGQCFKKTIERFEATGSGMVKMVVAPVFADGHRRPYPPFHLYFGVIKKAMGFSGSDSGRQPITNAGDIRDMGLIPGLGRSPGGGHGNPLVAMLPILQYSCLENPMDTGAWQATVHRVAKSQTQLMLLSTQEGNK